MQPKRVYLLSVIATGKRTFMKIKGNKGYKYFQGNPEDSIGSM